MNPKILRLGDVQSTTGLSRSLIYSLIASGQFPKQIRLSNRCVGFLKQEIDSWLEIKVQERNDQVNKQLGGEK